MPQAVRPHVLYIAWGFPPSRGGGVYRALATANAFADAGADVTVLTATRETFVRFTGVDPTLEDEVRPGVDVRRIPFAWPVLDTDITTYGRLRAMAPKIWLALRRRADVLPFPEPSYGPWRRPLEQAVASLHAERPVDLVVATANPHVTFAAAWYLHRKHGVPYVMDYRDAWLLDVFSGDRLHGPRSRAARWERRLVAAAKDVWFVNEPIRAWHAREYPEHADRMHVVMNGYDEDLFEAHEPTTHPPREHLNFGYVGTISPKVPLDVFVDAWRLARRHDPVVAAAQAHIYGYLGFFASANALIRQLLDEAEDDEVTYGGPVAKTRVRQVYDSLDVLLLMLGTGRYVTSGKVFEYLSTGLPIVSVHDPRNAVGEVLDGYPLWFPAADLTPAAVADALRRAAAFAADPDPRRHDEAVRFAEAFRRDRQLLPRVSALLGTETEGALA